MIGVESGQEQGLVGWSGDSIRGGDSNGRNVVVILVKREHCLLFDLINTCLSYACCCWVYI